MALAFDAAVFDALQRPGGAHPHASGRPDRGIIIWIVVAGEMVFVR